MAKAVFAFTVLTSDLSLGFIDKTSQMASAMT